MTPAAILLQTSRGPTPVRLDVMLATTPEEWSQGYRGRPAPVSDHEGILFAFPTEQRPRFVMDGVPFDLDLVVGDAVGRVLGGCRLHAHDGNPMTPGAPIRFALELKAGWTARQGNPVQLILP